MHMFGPFFQVLHALLTGGEREEADVTDVFSVYREDLKTDKLLSHLSRDEVLRPFLDVVIENMIVSSLNMCELTADTTGIFQQAVHQFADYPRLQLHVTIAGAEASGSELGSMTDVVVKQWDFSKPSSDLGKFHLVVLNNVLHGQADVLETLNKASELVVDGGFLLVKEVTDNFHVYAAIDPLLRKDLDWKLSLTGESYRQCHTDSRWQQLFERAGLQLVMDTCDGCLFSLYLLRHKIMVSEVCLLPG